ncbi:SGNH/GDSL hydrolase family protein [Pectinatus haikarae]|uniref:SGNH/GDSL hydrolase family protein n=1 Tax=Pectinatus haikarae TaxID=349096 RepID=UPI0018C8387B|nr:GDSL-type esterase/lipase family protein [Pectinatus haikarae]
MKYTIILIVLINIFILSGDAYSYKQLYPALEITTHYTEENPASAAPLLRWNENTEAVYYELEVFDKIPDRLSTNSVSAEHIYFTNQVFVNAFNLPIAEITEGCHKNLYWRVRAMDFDNKPVTNFSALELLYTDGHPSEINSPVTNTNYNHGNGSVLLYPVYQWIPNAGAVKFEVEVLSAPPENPNGTEPSMYRIFSSTIDFSCEYYDPHSRIGTYYWRVRGIDSDGRPIGVYSNAERFSNEPSADYQVGIFGDSISHGGGHLSYSPADFEFSYSSYLNFPSINLSESGDTIEMMVNRFDKDVLPFAPRYLIIMGASNSLRAGVSADKIIIGLKILQQKCQENDIQPILLTLPTINPHNINKIFTESTSSNWPYEFNKVNNYIRTRVHIDTAAEFPVPPEILPTEFALDGLHLDDNGKAIMGHTINENWSNVLAQITEDNDEDKVTVTAKEMELFRSIPDVYDL